MARRIVFIGFMGAGKTTAAREVAQALGREHRDADRLLEQHFGASIEDVFDRDGEAAFRAAERDLVLAELAREEDAVLSLGGGAVVDPDVQAALGDHTVVLCEIDLELAWSRASGRGRPLARDRDVFTARYAERAPVYAALADAVLDATTSRASLHAVAPYLAALQADTRLLWATSASGEYPVLVGAGLLDTPLEPWPAAGRRIVVSDETVAPLYAGKLADVAGLVEIPPGEQAKTLQTAEAVWRALVAQEVTRADHVVALGGGVVGDLAGFVAATFQRGIPVVQIPTTLVAQVDSAYGGKTGVDLPEAKNYVGAYHQPAAVLVDPATLRTLPPEEFAAGYAEVVKTALIAGGSLWETVAAGGAVDEHVIFACARTKLAVVAADERDGGRRQVLNLGHTVGHAIETVTGYARLRHGEAVGLGMLAALRLSGQDALRAQVAELLAAAGLPTTIDGLDAVA
ncbi:MAG TPA: bifunctional shikimate kinase/3-dehydroquinate synthase, partial [Solirubrobacteraceae bacterium]